MLAVLLVYLVVKLIPIEEAQMIVDEVLTSIKPGMNEAILLQVELSLKSSRN